MLSNRVSSMQVSFVRHKMVMYSLQTEKIKDVFPTCLFSLVIGIPYYLEGIHIGSLWVNQFFSHTVAPIVFLRIIEREAPILITDRLYHCYGWLYWPCTGPQPATAMFHYGCWAVVVRLYRYINYCRYYWCSKLLYRWDIATPSGHGW